MFPSFQIKHVFLNLKNWSPREIFPRLKVGENWLEFFVFYTEKSEESYPKILKPDKLPGSSERRQNSYVQERKKNVCSWKSLKTDKRIPCPKTRVRFVTFLESLENCFRGCIKCKEFPSKKIKNSLRCREYKIFRSSRILKLSISKTF